MEQTVNAFGFHKQITRAGRLESKFERFLLKLYCLHHLSAKAPDRQLPISRLHRLHMQDCVLVHATSSNEDQNGVEPLGEVMRV